MSQSRSKLLVVAVVFSSIVVVGWLAAEYWQANRNRGREQQATGSSEQHPTNSVDSLGQSTIDTRPLAEAADGYATSVACQECHGAQYNSWHDSYHRTMTQVATPETFMGSVGETLTRFGSTYGVELRGDELWGFQEQGNARAEKRIVMTTGSHHMQVCWFSASQESGEGRADHTDRTLGQFPLVYVKEAQRWVPRTSVFLQPPGKGPPPNETGRWNMSCIRCHTTHGRPNDWDSRAAEFGISCEACHGPAAEHVEYQRALAAGDNTSPAPVRDVVNPSELDSRASAQVCGQCHGVWELATDEQIEQWNHRGFPYRPGDDLHRHRVTYHADADLDSPEFKEILRRDPGFVRDAFWSDGMVRVSGREYNGLMGAPCFQANELNCLHCHSLHQAEDDSREAKEWANDQLAHDMQGDEACLQCHDRFRQEDALTSHTHHGARSSGSRCYNCHMPYTTYGLLKAIRSHHITSPTIAESVHVGRPNACNQCHLDQTLAWTSNHLSQWWSVESPPLNDEQEQIAASILWATRGDAGQRALMAWSFGWETAQRASGEDWMAPFLTLLLADQYDAVRYIAGRSIASLAGFEQFDYDFLASSNELVEAQDRALGLWSSHSRPARREALLIDSAGKLDFGKLQRLVTERDNRPIFLAE